MPMPLIASAALTSAGYSLVDPYAISTALASMGAFAILERYKPALNLPELEFSAPAYSQVNEIQWNNLHSNFLNQPATNVSIDSDLIDVCLLQLPQEERLSYLVDQQLAPKINSVKDLVDVLRTLNAKDAYNFMLQNSSPLFDLINDNPSLELVKNTMADEDQSSFIKTLIKFKVEILLAAASLLYAATPASEKFQASLKDLEKQMTEDDSLSLEDALKLATSADRLAKKINDSSVSSEEAVEEIVRFRIESRRFESSWGWRAILGAVIGAALGVVLGAMVGVVAAPAAALAALYAGTQAALYGASLLGAGGMAAGLGVGLWSTPVKLVPVVEAADNNNVASASPQAA